MALNFLACSWFYNYLYLITRELNKFLKMNSKKTKTTETFILPEQFEEYTKRGFVVFMGYPTAFGTYKAIKIELVAQ